MVQVPSRRSKREPVNGASTFVKDKENWGKAKKEPNNRLTFPRRLALGGFSQSQIEARMISTYWKR